MHSPFGAMAPRTTPSANTSELLEFNARVNVVASAPVDKFNGVPLGAYAVSTPYYGGAEAQAGSGTAQDVRSTSVETGHVARKVKPVRID